jgi:hypothetical protein
VTVRLARLKNVTLALPPTAPTCTPLPPSGGGGGGGALAGVSSVVLSGRDAKIIFTGLLQERLMLLLFLVNNCILA